MLGNKWNHRCELASLKSVIQRFTVRINQKKARIITKGDPRDQNGRAPSSLPPHLRVTDAPVIYRVSCVCVRYKNHCALQGLLRISKCDAAKMEKCKNAVLFKSGVGNARRADKLNRHFVGRGPPNDLNCLTYPQHRPKMANISPTYAQHSLQDGST